MIHSGRIHRIKKSLRETGNVVYWMSRDQRSIDNWGLLFARNLASSLNTELAVVFCLVDNFPDATIRQYDFMLHGLKEVSGNLQLKNIPFYLLKGNPAKLLNKFCKTHNVSHIICDFDPLHIKQKWQKDLAKSTDINLVEVDSHNIVPARIASIKMEYGAYTIRPKINKLINEYLGNFPELKAQQKTNSFSLQQINWNEINKSLKVDRSVSIVSWLHPGESAAIDMLNFFINIKLKNYNKERNDPNKDGTSNLSPYLHFGHISAQRIALEILKINDNSENAENFLEELIVRKELSDNFCLYNQSYDNLENIPDWAKKTLSFHENDQREYIYNFEQFESASTHEALWNAAQKELIKYGKMSGYMRMYWAKKILEWTENPNEAMSICLKLNDKYELDGRDPNGYAGCAWAIGGVHDRAWGERPVFGKIRYMNFNGAKRKFDTDKYIRTWLK